MICDTVWLYAGCRLVIFDMDGVVTDTSQLHARAWKETFDTFLEEYPTPKGMAEQFDIKTDYSEYVDGRTRPEGIRSFLLSRRIVLPDGEAGESRLDSVAGIGNFKNAIYLRLLEREGVRVFEDAVSLLNKLRNTELKIGLATSSKNADLVLGKANLHRYFDRVFDGNTVSNNNLRSKPNPDIFLFAAEQFSIPFHQCVVVEDSHEALAGVVAMGPGQAIGVERHRSIDQSSRFHDCHVVSDLNGVVVTTDGFADAGRED